MKVSIKQGIRVLTVAGALVLLSGCHMVGIHGSLYAAHPGHARQAAPDIARPSRHRDYRGDYRRESPRRYVPGRARVRTTEEHYRHY
ncbi:hypothetical protein Q4485_11780 [Granulosicoccaceae sp. 1_MG-2023]|nr:hypothetical protein [Granulosicoccaceae sp. 1_MG-2023]